MQLCRDFFNFPLIMQIIRSSLLNTPLNGLLINGGQGARGAWSFWWQILRGDWGIRSPPGVLGCDDDGSSLAGNDHAGGGSWLRQKHSLRRAWQGHLCRQVGVHTLRARLLGNVWWCWRRGCSIDQTRGAGNKGCWLSTGWGLWVGDLEWYAILGQHYVHELPEFVWWWEFKDGDQGKKSD